MFEFVTEGVKAILAAKAAEENKEITDEAVKRASFLPGNYNFDKEGISPDLYGTPNQVGYQQVGVDPALRQQQMDALSKMQALSEGRLQSQGTYDRYMAQEQANQMARAREQGVMTNAMQRGVGGSGLEMALRAQGGQEGANRQMQAGLNSAAQAALERMQANDQYQRGLSQVRNQDTDVSSQNAGIINRFNQYNADRQLQAQQRNVDMQNQAKYYNKNRGDTNERSRVGLRYQKNAAQNSLLPDQHRSIGQQYAPMMAGVDVVGDAANSFMTYGMSDGGFGNIGGPGAGGSNVPMSMAGPEQNASYADAFEQWRKMKALGGTGGYGG